MTNESREQILSDFQDCTGLENVEECIHILDEHQWNLINAIQAVHERIGGGNDNESTVPVQQTINNNKRQSDSNDFDDQDQPRIIKTIPGNQRTVKGISSIVDTGPGLEIGRITRGTIPTDSELLTPFFGFRDLNFTIEYCDRTEKLLIYDTQSVYELREKISEKLSIPPHKQHFLNWTMRSYDDRTILKALNLPKENIIHLSSIENGSTTNHTTSSSNDSGELAITVLCEDKSGNFIPHKFVFKSNTTIIEIKKQIEDITHIPIKEQNWQGLSGANDSDELRQTSITSQTKLIVHQSSNQQIPTITRNIKHSIVTTADQNDDEKMDVDPDNGLDSFEDDDSTVLSHNNSTVTSPTVSTSSRQPLIPDDCTDDASALEHFSRIFHIRYNSPGPNLYTGSLDQAIQHSLHSSIYDRCPLAIYLHNDNSVCANVFCSQNLSADSIIEYLDNNYIFWAWDVTSDTNKTKFFEILRRCVGNQFVQRVGSMDNDTFPLLLIVIRSRGSLELINIIEGKSTPSEVLSNLIQSHESFEQQRLRDADEESMREKRENLKKQQEDEYEQSRQADLAKERARQEAEDTNERLKQQRLQQQQESKARLPNEPNETEKNITRLKIRLPDDEGVLIRRFRIDENLQVLFDYLTSEGRMFGEYKLLTTYPKRDLTSIDQSETFEQLKLYPQEQLILESL